MPEGDTVWHTATLLHDALAGRVLTGCDIRVPRFAAVDLTGETVDEVISRGKHLFVRAGSASIRAHLKMEGSWRVTRGAVRSDHRVRIVLRAGEASAVGVDLGELEVLDRSRDTDAVAHLGPDLLGADWDAQVACANLIAAPERGLAETLLDQRVLAGIGNVYANELCFLSGHLPSAPVADVAQPLRLMRRAREMLWANRARWARCTTGNTRHGERLWVYGRAGLPCRRCGTVIRSDSATTRITFWCPNCQR